MNTTSLGLLDQLKTAKPDAPQWRRLQDIYTPLIRSWMYRVPGLHEEAEDLAQEVLVVLFREVGDFERRRDGSFRAWIRQITVNRIRSYCKTRQKRPLTGIDPATDGLLSQLEDPTSDLVRQWDQDHDKHVFQKLLVLVQTDFEPNTWEAFTRFALNGQPIARIAGELGMSEGAVIQAKFRILKRMREEVGEMLD